MTSNATHGAARTPGSSGQGDERGWAAHDAADANDRDEEDDATRDWDNEGGHERGRVAQPAGRPAPSEPEALRLTGVLATALPPELGTPHEPVAYTVPAVFSRRVTREEQDAIEGDAVRRRLAEAGFEDVELTVADRRLLIGHTSLAALQAGLAHEVAQILRDLGQDLVAEHDRLAAEIADLQKDEERRAGAVHVEADAVRFD